MLNKLTKLTNLLSLTGLNAIAFIANQNSAQAFNFELSSYDNVDAYTYNLNLGNNEDMYVTDADSPTGNESFIRLSNMIDVFDASINNAAPFEIVNQNATTVELQPTATINGAQTYNNFLTIRSTAAPEIADLSLAYVDSSLGGSTLDITPNGGITGPVTAVPFEPSSNLGIFTIFGIVGINYYRQKSKSS